MKKHLFLKLVLAVIALLIASGTALAEDPAVSGRLIVKFKAGKARQEMAGLKKAYNAAEAGTISDGDTLLVSVPEKLRKKMLSDLQNNPNIEFAEPDYLATAFLSTNDPSFANQWGLENTGQTINGKTGKNDADIDASSAWKITSGDAIVAVLDTGIDQNHEDLIGKIVTNKNFSDSATIDDLYGHGTHVAGIIAANTFNGTGVAGVCPYCQILNVKVLNDQGSGYYSSIASGIRWAADNGAKVINMSLGGTAKSTALEQAVNYAWNNGVVIVASAGNGGNSAKNYPAAYTNVIAVAATTNRDLKASFSSYGSSWVDVAAPGEYIYSTTAKHQTYLSDNGYSQNYDYLSGTSMAAPMVSAAAALVWSSPYGTGASAVRSRLESTSEKITGTKTYWSKGRVNAAKAVGAAIF